MQFEKIRTINKRKIIVGGLISLSVISALIYLPSRAKYRTAESFNIVNGTINYKVADLKVMAMYQQNNAGEYEEITTMPSSGYTINEEKTYCTTNNVTQVKGKIKTENGKVTLENLQKGDKCYLYFDRKKNTAEDILGNLGIENPKEPTSNMFASVATTDDGVFKVDDPVYGGTSYYYRGAVTNNYVQFAGFCWRIIRINGDGSIRMIYDGRSCNANGTSTAESIAVTNKNYNESYNRSEYVGYTWAKDAQRTTDTTNKSNLKTQTESWFNTNIKGIDLEKVADGKFCNDRNTASGNTWNSQPSSAFYYAARGRLESAKTPTLACPDGDVYTLKAGAITADEVSFAGGVYNTANNKYYLYNGQNYLIMSPYDWNGKGAGVFYVRDNGLLGDIGVNDAGIGVRPVINLRADTIFSSGNGTLNSPYIVQ